MFNAVYVVHRIAETLSPVLGISLVFDRTSRQGLLLKGYRKNPSVLTAGQSQKPTKNGPRGPWWSPPRSVTCQYVANAFDLWGQRGWAGVEVAVEQIYRSLPPIEDEST